MRGRHEVLENVQRYILYKTYKNFKITMTDRWESMQGTYPSYVLLNADLEGPYVSEYVDDTVTPFRKEFESQIRKQDKRRI